MVVNGSKENGKVPYLYFDTNFITDINNGKGLPCSIIERAKKRKWKYHISFFCIMEALDIKQEHFFFNKKVGIGEPLKKIISKRRDRDLSSSDLKEIQESFVNRLLKPHKMEMGYYFVDVNSWFKCLEIVRDTNINSSDAMHLTTALGLNCDILITSDNHFISEGNKYIKEKMPKNKLVLCLPEKFDDILREKSFL